LALSENIPTIAPPGPLGGYDYVPEGAMTRAEVRSRFIRVGFFSFLYLSNVLFARDQFPVLLTLPSLFICMIGVWRIRKPSIQVADMFWLCCFLFFVISPIQRIDNMQFGAPWERSLFRYTFTEFATAEAVVVLSLIPFLFTRLEFSPPARLSAAGPGVMILLMIALVSFAAFVVLEGGFGRVLSSRIQQRQTEGFIGSLLFLGFLSVSTILLTLQARRTRSPLVIASFLAAFVMLFVLRNPFNASRFSLVGVWLPVVFAAIGGAGSVTFLYIGSLAALLFVFPILSLTTRFGLDALDQLNQIDFTKTYLNIPFFDLFDTLVHCVRFMEYRSFEFGQKTLAVVLFFVPRSIWPSKPVVGGLDVGYDIYYAAHQGGTFNLSFFLGGDLYIDFGVWGVIFGFALVAFLLDKGCKTKYGFVYSYPVLASVIMAGLPILIRGPVGAILPLFTCQVFAVFFMNALYNKRAVTDVSR
jgi:hypothetical protein